MVLLICQGASIKCDESFCPALTALGVLDYATYAPRVGWETWCLHGLRATSFGRRGDRIVGAFFGRRFFSMRDISDVSCSAKETGADVGGATHPCAHRSLRKLWFPKRGCSWWASLSGCGLEVLREESGRGNLLRSRCASAPAFRFADRCMRTRKVGTWFLENSGNLVATRVGLCRRSASSCKQPSSDQCLPEPRARPEPSTCLNE